MTKIPGVQNIFWSSTLFLWRREEKKLIITNKQTKRRIKWAVCNNYDVHKLTGGPSFSFLFIFLCMMPSPASIFVDMFDVEADRYQMPTKDQYWQRHRGVRVT